MSVKVGQIYKGTFDEEPYTVRIEEVSTDGDFIVYKVVEDSADPEHIGNTYRDLWKVFKYYFQPVYTIEGFEV